VRDGIPVAGVDAGAQDLYGLVDVAVLGEQVGDPDGGYCASASAQARNPSSSPWRARRRARSRRA
jgi:hypothetical protein